MKVYYYTVSGDAYLSTDLFGKLEDLCRAVSDDYSDRMDRSKKTPKTFKGAQSMIKKINDDALDDFRTIGFEDIPI